MVHVSQLETAHEIWKSLKTIHNTKGNKAITVLIQCNLFKTFAQEGDDIVEHLTKLKNYCEWLNMLDDEDFKIRDGQFKAIIASSLSQLWDTFTLAYVGRHAGVVEKDSKK